MSNAFSLNKLAGIFGRKSQDEEIAGLVKAQTTAARISVLMAYREWPEMEAILNYFQQKAIDGLAAKNISKEETQRLTNRMEQLRDIRNKLVAKVKAGEVAEVRLDRIKEKQSG